MEREEQPEDEPTPADTSPSVVATSAAILVQNVSDGDSDVEVIPGHTEVTRGHGGHTGVHRGRTRRDIIDLTECDEGESFVAVFVIILLVVIVAIFVIILVIDVILVQNEKKECKQSMLC